MEREELPGNIVVLPRYCIENFLVDEEALLKIMDEEDYKRDASDLRKELDFDAWVGRTRESLREMFKLFAVAHKTGSGIPTVGRTYKSVYAGANGDVDLTKVNNVCKEIKKDLEDRFGVGKIAEEMDAIERLIDKDSCFLWKYVSAKDYSLPLLLIRMKSIVSTKSPNINLKVRLSACCSVDPFRIVIESMSRILGRTDLI